MSLISLSEKAEQQTVGLCDVPAEFSLGPNNLELSLTVVHKTPSWNTSFGVGHHHPAGLCTVRSKL